MMLRAVSTAIAALAATALYAQGAILSPVPADSATVGAIANDPAQPLPDTLLPADGDPVDLLNYQESAQRMTVGVDVLGQGPYAFLVDTGAERTVISRELATQLDLGRGRDVRMHSMTEATTIATVLIPHLQISKNSVSDIHAPALPAANIGAAGMLGVDSLQKQRVIFDFRKKTMAIWPSTKRPEIHGSDAIVVTGKNLYGRLILMNARIDGQRIIVIIDTGSEVTIGNNALRRKLAGKKRLRETVPVELMSVTGGRLTADYTQVRRITIGDLTINNMPIGFADVHPFRQLKLTDYPAILLGMDALKLFSRVSVDFERREVRFLPPDIGGGPSVARMAMAAPRGQTGF